MSNLIDAYVKQVKIEAIAQSKKSVSDEEYTPSYLLGYIESMFGHTLHALNLTEEQEAILVDRLTSSIVRV